MINLVLLGSGGGIPTPHRHLSSMIINYKGRQILIDCGEGTQVAMRKVHSGFKSIDLICLSHYHGDHIFGLPGLLSTMANSGRREAITIIGPLGLNKIIKAILEVVSHLPFEVKLLENPKNNLNLNIRSDIIQVEEGIDFKKAEIVVSTLELDHSLPCLGYSFYIARGAKFRPEKAQELEIPKRFWSRLQVGENVQYGNKVYKPNMVLGEERKGIKLSYITDTRPIDDIIDFIEDSDLFVCEGTYGDDEDLEKAVMNKHMTFREASELALKGNVKELLLTHFSTAIEKAESYKGNATETFNNTIIGYDGYKKNIAYGKE